MEKNNDQHHYSIAGMFNLTVSEPYFLFNFLAFFSYIPVRFAASSVLSPHFTSHLLHREVQAFLAFCIFAAVKMVKEETWEAFIADTLFYAEVFLVAIALVLDYHLAIWYMLAFLVIYIFTQQPPYLSLGTSNQLTPLQLETILTEGRTSKFWLVEFRVLSSSNCIRTSRIFPELSITFSNKNLSFGTVDIGLFPNVAPKFGISLGNSKQLPTYILFENAEEAARFPEFNSEAKASIPVVTKVYISDMPIFALWKSRLSLKSHCHLEVATVILLKLLCRHFELDKRLLDYVNGR